MKTTRLITAILFIMALAGTAVSHETWDTYTTDDGLPNNEIRAIAEDSNGIKWFGTDGGGVARLDGEWREGRAGLQQGA